MRMLPLDTTGPTDDATTLDPNPFAPTDDATIEVADPNDRAADPEGDVDTVEIPPKRIEEPKPVATVWRPAWANGARVLPVVVPRILPNRAPPEEPKPVVEEPKPVVDAPPPLAALVASAPKERSGNGLFVASIVGGVAIALLIGVVQQHGGVAYARTLVAKAQAPVAVDPTPPPPPIVEAPPPAPPPELAAPPPPPPVDAAKPKRPTKAKAK